MKNYRRLIALILLVSTLGSITTFANTVNKISINGVVTEIPESISIRGGLIPLRWVAMEVGASSVLWENGTVSIEIPDFLERHQYVNYLNGLRNEKNGAYPLPARLQSLELPAVGFEANHSVINQEPLTLNITSKDYCMPWALYDYKLVKGTLFVDASWLNTLFLASTKYEDETNTLEVSYMDSKELRNHIETLEKVIKPTTAEEALALWIRGQQMRSGALQYIALSPQLKQEAMSKVHSQGWVTGGSSPSLGEAVVLETKKISDNTISYVIQYNEMLGGEVYNQFEETITVQAQTQLDEGYWYVVGVENNSSYYSILTSILDE